MSRQFATNVTTIYDIFCPVPFLPSPFGFRRIGDTQEGVQLKGVLQKGAFDTVLQNSVQICAFL